MLYNRCTGIYKFGNNTKTQIKFRSYFSGKKSASYGPGNMVYTFEGMHHVLVNVFIRQGYTHRKYQEKHGSFETCCYCCTVAHRMNVEQRVQHKLLP